MELAAHIKDLLLEHDCVVVPEFGGFIANYEPAQLNKETHVIQPPSKRVSFNKKLTSNDGLLLQSIQQNNDLNYTDALSFVRETVLNWNNVLNNNGRVQLPGVGVIFKDKDANYRFNRDAKSSMSLFSYGLQTVALKPIIVEEEVEEPRVVAIESGKEAVKTSGRSKWKYAVAVAILLPVAFYSYWIPVQSGATDRGFVTAADFNPFSSEKANHSEVARYEKRPVSDALESVEMPKLEPISKELAIGDRTFKVASTEATSTKVVLPETESVEVITTTNSGNYHVIAGCFSKIENAENQVAAFKEAGYNSYILDVVGGLHRVCVQSLNSSLEAGKVKRAVLNLGKSAWILKR